MKKYNHLDLQDRHKIKAWLDAGQSQTKIAEIIGVNKSTISRELSRNVPTRGRYANEYRLKVAPQKTNQPHRTSERGNHHCTYFVSVDPHPVAKAFYPKSSAALFSVMLQM